MDGPFGGTAIYYEDPPEPCPVCKGNSTQGPYWGKDEYSYDCPRCGKYSINGSFASTLRNETGFRHLLCGRLREASDRREALPILYESVAADLERKVPTSVLDKARLLLHWIARNTEYTGQYIFLNRDTDYPVVYAKHPDELSYYLQHLDLVYWIQYRASLTNYECRLTPKGWEEIDSDRKRNVDSTQAFVAMSFAEDMKTAYSDGILPAIQETGFKPLRIDGVEHVDNIVYRIIAEIRESRFVVADFTGQRGGVYFEAGFAMGLGLQVIWTCRENDSDNLHFDTSQYNYILWKTPQDLREKLAVRIKAVIVPGSNNKKTASQ